MRWKVVTRLTQDAKRISKFVVLVLMVGVLWFSDTSYAVLVYFDNITNNNPGDAAIGEAQLTVDVTNGSDTVTFTFHNEGAFNCSIAEIYFDDGSLLSFNSIIENPPDVDFKQEDIGDVNPKNLPGANLAVPPFVATTMFSIEPENPQPYHGVNPGETVGLVYNLVDEQTVDDILNELASGELRIGIHVIDFDSGGSESFINLPVPEPATLFFLCLGPIVLMKKRRY